MGEITGGEDPSSGFGVDRHQTEGDVEVPGMADVRVLRLAGGGGVPVRELAETTGASGSWRTSEVELQMSVRSEPLFVGRGEQNREGAEGAHSGALARRRAIPYLPFREVMLERTDCGSSETELESGARFERPFVGRVERRAEAVVDPCAVPQIVSSVVRPPLPATVK